MCMPTQIQLNTVEMMEIEPESDPRIRTTAASAGMWCPRNDADSQTCATVASGSLVLA